jgi:HK97 family phage prohead protease
VNECIEIFVRNDSVIADVNKRQRLIDLIVVPWDQEAPDALWRGEVWRETFQRGAFDGIQDHAGRVPVNRQHVKDNVVGRAVTLDPSSQDGLIGRVKIAATERGEETLELAADEMLHPSGGFYIKSPADHILNRRMMTRRVVRAFLDHIALVDTPAYVGARVLAVREAPSGLTVAESPLPPTPALDDAMNDPLLAWAAERLAAK